MTTKKRGSKIEINRQSCHLNISQRKVDPSIIEYFSVTNFHVVKTVDEGGKNWSFYLRRRKSVIRTQCGNYRNFLTHGIYAKYFFVNYANELWPFQRAKGTISGPINLSDLLLIC